MSGRGPARAASLFKGFVIRMYNLFLPASTAKLVMLSLRVCVCIIITKDLLQQEMPQNWFKYFSCVHTARWASVAGFCQCDGVPDESFTFVRL